MGQATKNCTLLTAGIGVTTFYLRRYMFVLAVKNDNVICKCVSLHPFFYSTFLEVGQFINLKLINFNDFSV